MTVDLLPGRKVEAWKYTDARRFAALAEPITAPVPPVVTLDAPAGVRLLRLDEAKADPALAARLGPIVEAGRPFLALNDNYQTDGVVLVIPAGAVVERPLTVEIATAGQATHLRHLILAGANSQAAVAFRNVGTGAVNVATEIVLEPGARLGHYVHQDAAADAVHMATTIVTVARDATYDGFVLSTGAATSRQEVVARLEGPGGEARVNGAYLGHGSQHLDTTTLIEHIAPDCRSREVMTGVLDDKARGVFQGKIHVLADAQRTDGHQLSRALLLSPGAEVDAKPELEIYADDVKCSHGATTGSLDRDALFYLRARGLGEAEARALLIAAFLRQSIDEIGEPGVRERFGAAVEAWLARREAA